MSKPIQSNGMVGRATEGLGGVSKEMQGSGGKGKARQKRGSTDP